MRRLTRGEFSMDVGDGQVRFLRWRDVELAERVYFAVRSTEWHVLPVTWREIDDEDRRGSVRWLGRVTWHDVDVALDVRVRLHARDGLTFAVEARSQSSFDYSRLGIFVILPVRPLQGRPVRGRLDGSEWTGHMPVLAGPQRLVQGRPEALFPPHRELEITVEEGTLRLSFTGDDFEVEDERNWTEMGFKVYAGPFVRGWPLHCASGVTISQTVNVAFHPVDAARTTQPSARTTQPSDVVEVLVDERRSWSLPVTGHRAALLGRPLAASELDLLRTLAPEFVLAELHHGRPGGEGELEEGVEQARAIGARLAVALFVGGSVADAVGALTRVLRRLAMMPFAVLLYEEGPGLDGAEGSGTPPGLRERAVPLLRRAFPAVIVLVGSELNLAEATRTPPVRGSADGFCIGMSPSGHSDETWAIMRNLPAQGDAIRTLLAHDPSAIVAAAPITLQIPSGGGPRPPDVTPWPASVDPRQPDEVAASWALGSLMELCRAGADLAVYFETVGWRGLLERVEGAPSPFPSRAGQVFPLFHLFADLAVFRAGTVHRVRLSDGRVACLCGSAGDRQIVLLANLTERTVTVRVRRDSDGRADPVVETEIGPYGFQRHEVQKNCASDAPQRLDSDPT